MKLYTIYTESHKEMYERYFLKTLPDEFELVSLEIPQECTGDFYSNGWDKTCYRKVELFLKVCEENMGSTFVFSDVDIQFFGKIKDVLVEELGDHDIACQNDTGNVYCSGFFICKANERTLNMFRAMIENYAFEDQATLNNHIHMVKSKFLSEKFFTIGHLLGGWQGQDFEMPYEILMHHSNWVIGVETKIRLMDKVREENEKRIIRTQEALNRQFSNWRPAPEYPTYPPYHEGLYLEDKFYELFTQKGIISERYYIPVFWTTCYCDGKIHGLQEELSKLNPDLKYFTLSQHDDAINETLPPNTIHFSAGGNRANGIPIPLICSPIREEYKPKNERDIFCSFVGSLTHRIRVSLQETLKNNEKYLMNAKQWSSYVDNSDLQNFFEITSRSKFALCPRGYGKSSFRLYETMQLGAIPVFVYDEKWFPFEEEIDWNEFSVLVHESEIPNIDEILSSYTDERIAEMQGKLKKYWQENFTMESIFEKILDRI